MAGDYDVDYNDDSGGAERLNNGLSINQVNSPKRGKKRRNSE